MRIRMFLSWGPIGMFSPSLFSFGFPFFFFSFGGGGGYGFGGVSRVEKVGERRKGMTEGRKQKDNGDEMY